MIKNKHVLIITPDFLQAHGLKTLLEDIFSDENFSFTLTTDDIKINPTKCDLLFVRSDYYFSLYNKLAPVKNKTIVLNKGQSLGVTDISVLNIFQDQDSLIDDLNNLCISKLNQRTSGNQQSIDNKFELSDREIEVLALIAKGYMNKTIADELNISINTVLTHRKNLTSKLGIKTVSGMTMYAILNGLISAEDIQ